MISHTMLKASVRDFLMHTVIIMKTASFVVITQLHVCWADSLSYSYSARNIWALDLVRKVIDQPKTLANCVYSLK